VFFNVSTIVECIASGCFNYSRSVEIKAAKSSFIPHSRVWRKHLHVHMYSTITLDIAPFLNVNVSTICRG
jgi:hypothetical protein